MSWENKEVRGEEGGDEEEEKYEKKKQQLELWFYLTQEKLHRRAAH